MLGRLKNWWSGRQREPKNSHLPVNLAKIINGLPDSWRLESYDPCWGGGWAAELSFGGRKFRVDEEVGRPINANEISDEEQPISSSPLNQSWHAWGGPACILNALLQIEQRQKKLDPTR